MAEFPDVTAANYDLIDPLQQILRGLSILPDANVTAEGIGVALGGTPQSVSIIEAGGTAFSKGWAVVAGALGGVGTIGAGLGGFWTSISDSVRGRLVLASGIVMATALIAIAIIVSADVYGRSRAAVSQYHARAQLAAAWLALAHQPLHPAAAGAAAAVQPAAAAPAQVQPAAVLAALAAAGKQAAVKNHGEDGHLGGVRLDNAGRLHLRFIGADANQDTWLASDDIAEFEFTYP